MHENAQKSYETEHIQLWMVLKACRVTHFFSLPGIAGKESKRQMTDGQSSALM